MCCVVFAAVILNQLNWWFWQSAKMYSKNLPCWFWRWWLAGSLGFARSCSLLLALVMILNQLNWWFCDYWDQNIRALFLWWFWIIWFDDSRIWFCFFLNLILLFFKLDFAFFLIRFCGDSESFDLMILGLDFAFF